MMLFSVTTLGADTDDVLSAVPDELKEYLPDTGDAAEASDVASAFDAGWLLKTILSILSDVAPKAVSSVVTVLGILILA